MTENTKNADGKTSDDASKNKEDEELSALLDSALEDFNTSSNIQQNAKPTRPDVPDTLFDDEVLLKKILDQTAFVFNQNFESLVSPGVDGSELTAEKIGENIQRITEAAIQTAGIDASPDTEFSGIIAQTLKNLQENAENLQNGIPEEELTNLLASFNATDGEGGGEEFMSVIQDMMQSLFSKEILQPTLVFILDKYPQWLEDNKSKLSAGDFDRYTEQLKFLKELWALVEKESKEESQEVKKARFDQILALAEKIQNCGSPPAELLESFDEYIRSAGQGNIQLSPDFPPKQCSLM